jgi:hypothetical protein
MRRIFFSLVLAIGALWQPSSVRAAPHELTWGIDTVPSPATVCLYYTSASCLGIGTMSAAGVFSLPTPGPIGSVTPNTGAFTTLSASGLTSLNASLSVTGVGTSLAAIGAINNVTPTSYLTPGYSFIVNESLPSYGATNSHFGFVVQAGKQTVGSTTTGSRSAATFQQLGVGGTSSDFLTGSFELSEPCLSPFVCNAFNLSGNFTGNNPYAYIPAAMTPTTVIGEEIDNTTLSAGSLERAGLRIVDIASTQHGTVDAAINTVSSGVGFNVGLYWGDNTATFSLSTGGTFLDTPVTATVLNTFMNFANISGTASLAQILLPAGGSVGIGWGTHAACCAGGSVISGTSVGGGVIDFGNAFTVFQFTAANSVFIEPKGQIIQVPQTIATVLGTTCNSGSEGSTMWIKDSTGAAVPTFHLIVAGSGATQVDSLVSCNGTNWVYN